MRFPWANIALLLLVAVELVSGYLGLTHSNPEWLAAMHLHRIAGFAILALFLWKARNIFGSFRIRRNWQRDTGAMLWASLLLALLLAALGLGLAWSHLGPYHWQGMAGMTLHLIVGLLLLPLLLWHTARRRVSLRMRYVADRRNFLRLGGLALAGAALWQASERLSILAGGPGAGRRFTGSYPEDGADFPVTMWLNDRVPHIDGAGWRLTVDGYVEHPYTLDLAEFQQQRQPLTATLDCTGGWHTTRQWEGLPISELLARAGMRPGAGSITIRSRTGYFRRYSLNEARRALLAGWVDGAPLSLGHGYPARMVEPHKRGYDWVKWVDRITVNDTGKFWQPPLPLT